MDMLAQLKLFSGIAVTSGFGSYAAAVQQVVTPDTIPLGVVVGLFVAAVGATAKIVRLIDGINRRLDLMEQRLDSGDRSNEKTSIGIQGRQ